MITRNVEARIVKLEAHRQRPNEILLIWRKPGETVKAAIAEAQFAPGDRVICVHWFGEGDPPPPRWHGERLSESLPPDQYKYIVRSLERIAKGEPGRDPGFAAVPPVAAHRMVEMSDNDLLHAALGVAT